MRAFYTNTALKLQQINREDVEDAEVSLGLEHEALTGQILAAAFEVHACLGPGLLESAYEVCLAKELELGGLAVRKQVALPIVYKGYQIETGYRLDLVVEDIVVVELKAVEALNRVHEAQLISYLRLSGYPVGLLLNFHTRRLREGIRRFGNTENEKPPRPPRPPC